MITFIAIFTANNELSVRADNIQTDSQVRYDSYDKDGSENYQNYRGGIAVNNSGSSQTLTKTQVIPFGLESTYSAAIPKTSC